MRTSFLYSHGFKGMVILLGITLCYVFGEGDFGLARSRQKILEGRKPNNPGRHVVKSIQSEDGDIIDCIDIYKQSALDHPSLRKHIIQMTPSYNPTMEAIPTSEQSSRIVTSQLWKKNGSCPKGTIPVRRTQNKGLLSNSEEGYSKKKPSYYDLAKTPNNKETTLSFHQKNHSKAILLTEGYNYAGVKGDIKVWNPHVESDNEYSTSRISLRSGPYYDFESVESGWAVNPSVYGDRKTRLFVYWTVDASKKTGCFDLTCPGFVQTSSEIALGAAIYPISVFRGLPYQITLFIFKDPETNNLWLQYGEKTNIGYWPRNLFKTLSHGAECAEWGGDVYSSKLGQSPHTKTAMGNGNFPDYISGNSGFVKRMRILDISLNLKSPDWAGIPCALKDCFLKQAAILVTLGFNDIGAKGYINVWNPNVESPGDFSTAQIWVKGGPGDDFESLESGWVVNPKLYGEKMTRFFAYWTKDAYKKTGCFDLPAVASCKRAPRKPLDPKTRNWWLRFGDDKNVGYWPAGSLIFYLNHTSTLIEWGEVYNPNAKKTPHIKTAIDILQRVD
ncbi:hypothetical protein CRYUN_Cryun33cG0087200 [Craigia yunnanensis]